MSLPRARQFCDLLSKVLQKLTDEDDDMRGSLVFGIIVAMIPGIPFFLALRLITKLRQGSGLSFKEEIDFVGLIIKALPKRTGAQFLRLKEEEWCRTANSYADKFRLVNPQVAEIYSDMCQRCFLHRRDSSLEAKTCQTRGKVLYSLGLYDVALEHLERAAIYYENHEAWRELAECIISAAVIWNDLDEHDKALAAIEAARSDAAKSDWEEGVKACDEIKAEIYVKIGRNQEAISLFKSAGYEAHKTPSSLGKMLQTLTLLSLDSSTTAKDEYLSCLRQVRAESERVGMALYALTCDLQEANYWISLGNCKKAIKLLTNLDSCTEHTFETRHKQALLMGRALSKAHKKEKARQYYRKAVDLIEEHRDHLTDEKTQSRHLGAACEAYREVIYFLYENSWHVEAFECLERLKSRMITDQLAVRNPIKISPTAISYDEVLDLLPDNETALIEFFPSQEQTLVFVVRKNDEFPNPVIMIEDYGLGQCLDDLIEIEDSSSPEESRLCLDRLLEKLNHKVLSKLLPHLDGVNEAIFIPYSCFHLLPFHAMSVSEDGNRRYLIDDISIRYAPSCKLLKECLARETALHKDVVAVSSNPAKDLYFASHEMKVLQRLFPTTQVFTDPSKEDLCKCMPEASIFHFSGHANSGGLVLAENAMMSPGEISSDLRLSQSCLTTLSACWTGYSPFGHTDEAFGLPSALMLAGSPTVVCSLWSVSDFSSTLLMAKMYQAIKDGTGKAESLRQAQSWLKTSSRDDQLALIKELGLGTRNQSVSGHADTLRFSRGIRWEKHLPEDLSHPYYWAGFICSGAP